MTRRLLTLAAVLSAAPLFADTPKGFTPLFNGKDLAGWHGWAIHSKGGNPADLAKLAPEERQAKIAEWTADAAKHWKAENGELVNDGFGAYLATDGEFNDYELLIEYKTVPKADSGIYLKGVPQVQIWDPNEEDKTGLGKKFGSGGLWNNSKDAPGKDPLVKADKPLGEWNQFRIVQVGDRTTIWLNGQLVVDNARLENYWDKAAKKVPAGPLAKKGPVLLQTHGGEIRWRNIAVRQLTPDEANKWVMDRSGDGFKPLFDGKSLDGWQGALDSVEVADGAIVWKAKKGGVVFSKDSFEDFVAQVEYKVPPGGNNGLAIRYPGKGGASQEAMCEVQILDDDAEKYAKLDPRQFTGSAYGMAAPVRGYGRPAGEWNLMQVTAKGHTLKIELNGSQILDADLSTITEFKDKSTHPGKDRLDGFFGFCGHNDPVAFRTVRVKPLAK